MRYADKDQVFNDICNLQEKIDFLKSKKTKTMYEYILLEEYIEQIKRLKGVG